MAPRLKSFYRGCAAVLIFAILGPAPGALRGGTLALLISMTAITPEPDLDLGVGFSVGYVAILFILILFEMAILGVLTALDQKLNRRMVAAVLLPFLACILLLLMEPPSLYIAAHEAVFFICASVAGLLALSADAFLRHILDRS